MRISAEKYISNFLKFLWVNQRGSASVEFVALAIPLFIPLFIFMNSFASASDSQDSLRTLAREAARGFVTSANDEIAFGVAHQILTQGAIILGHEDAIARGEILMQIECSVRPCISPNAGIRVIMSKTEKNGSKITVSAIEYVSPWA